MLKWDNPFNTKFCQLIKQYSKVQTKVHVACLTQTPIKGSKLGEKHGCSRKLLFELEVE